MPLPELFSYRKRVAKGDTPDVFVFDELPDKLRNQIILIWRDAIGPYSQFDAITQYSQTPFKPNNNEGWEKIHRTVASDHGLLELSEDDHPDVRCETYLLNSSFNDALDLVEASFSYIDITVRDLNHNDRKNRGIKMTADDALEELNERFQRAGVGYQYEDGKILRVDSELIHSEVVRPALRFLQQKGFEGPCDEFLQAYAHYRAGEMKDAIIDANNAFESTLKTICDQRQWQYSPGVQASDLVKVVKKNGLLPDYLGRSFDQLSATLKSGLPKVRNEEGAHGQGNTPQKTPDYVATYALHLAAAKILFLVKAHKYST